MATEPATPTPVPALPEQEKAIRRKLREAKLQEDLEKLDAQHQKERQALSQELRELAVGRKTVQDQLWADWISSPFPDLGPGRHSLTPQQQLKLSAELPRADRCVNVVKHHLDGGKERVLDSRLATVVELGEEEAASKLKYIKKLSREENRRSSQPEDGASSSTAALNGKEPGEGDEEIPYWVESVLKASQQREKEKQALVKELLREKNELYVEVQRLLEVLDEKELRKAYEHRITEEDLPEINKAHQRTKRTGLWRFLFKKKPVALEGTVEAHIAHVDSWLGNPKLPVCYEEIKKLLDIEKNPIYSKALQEWNRKEELFSRRVERKKNRVANLKNEVYQLIGFFSVFQGVVLTAVSQSTLLDCDNKWSPIALSVLASVISTSGVIQKLHQINHLQGNVDSEERDFATAVQVGQQLRRPGSEGIDFVKLNVAIERNSNRKSKLLKNTHLAWIYFLLVTSTLLAFGFLFPFSFWKILCKPAGAPPPVNN